MKIIFVFLAFALLPSISAQSFVGLWEVSEVNVGNLKMTPSAKWVRINDDLSFDSGNGWTKNSEGQVHFSKKDRLIRPIATTGIEDPFGPFELTIEDQEMTWRRNEEGNEVTVNYRRIDKLPMGPADKVQGLWKAIEEDKLIFIRPDRRYRVFNEDGSEDVGVWHMDGHRPLLSLLNSIQEKEDLVYEVKFEKSNLLLKKAGRDEDYQIFARKKKFPD